MRSLYFLAALACGLSAAHARPRIEVGFALDATGSMSPCIGQARDRIKSIAADLAAGDPAPDVRFGLVTFRDKGDDYVTRKHPFTRDIDAMRKYLDETHPKGGGDVPEAVLEALEAGIKGLRWSRGQDVVRLLYLIGDAGPQRYADGPDPDALLKLALQKGIVVHSIACGNMGQPAKTFFEDFSRRSEGRLFALGRAAKSTAGARASTSLGAAVSGSARAYSDSVGVDFKAGEPVKTKDAGVPSVRESGLLGAHARMVVDAMTWTDVWAAHTSLAEARAATPRVDFTTHHVLVLGGANAGVSLVELIDDGERRVARVAPTDPGVQFLLVPAKKRDFVALNAGDDR